MTEVLNVKDLTIAFGTAAPAVDGVSFTVNAGETVALVGESGSGKSVTALSSVKLLPDSANISGSITYRGTEMVGADESTLRDVRGNDISFIFQEPMTSLNPLHTIEKQLTEGLALHQTAPDQSLTQRAVQWFVSKRITQFVSLKSALIFMGALLLYFVISAGIDTLRGQGSLARIEDPQTGIATFLYALTGLFSLLWSILWFLLALGVILGGIGLLLWPVQYGLATALRHWLSDNPYRAKCLELLEKVGIRNAANRLDDYPHQLSGGQRQRVMIAMALANGPDLLIADEPTTALDVTIQAQILDLLEDVQKAEGMGMLFITHDLTIVRKIADRVCVMQNGKIVETGPTKDIFDAPQHPYTKTLLAAEPTGVPDPVAEDAEEILSTENFRVWFPIKRGIMRTTVDHVKAVNGASFSVRAGETLGIVGESGSGKTTLALGMMRLISSDGPVVFLGDDVQGLRNRALQPLRRDMQMVFQDPYGSLSPRMTVEQIVSEGLGVHANTKGMDTRQAVKDILIEVGLDPDTIDRYPHEFSGGQRQRIAIARAMIQKPRLVVLDEPTSALDMTVQVQIVNLLRDLQKKYGLAFLFISHDLKVVRALSHKVLVMRQGDIVEAGTGEEIFAAPKTEYAKTLMAAAFDGVATQSVQAE
ncbi:ABC transporter ATP-binding protein [Amylibacter sp. IMCC11727]|uniref:ABC transporter ATP-binding protein n=1 Tax=Amylibacter sp. IMCC11727 TaxID=3039851 RepID=UPI00244DDBAC|nr:ABC transporter ATP-binding protein [Amylibacter sp. IMCC11727]WGI21484.1 ABC transporter ATP-binding protein [Amylibacter sp. IMCC11727]